MNIRMARMRVIVNLLNAQIITSQEQLSAALLKQGYQTTQATLSRDLHDLRAEKKVLPDGSFKYVIPVNPLVEKKVLGIDRNLAKMSINSVDYCGQFAVVKTRPGFANAVAYDIDSRAEELILGTIAGDDTILVIPRDTTTRDQLNQFFSAINY